jgi:hypothetical protein
MAAEVAYPVKKLVNLTEELASRISSFRYEQRIPSENEAIRRLIEAGLRAEVAPAPEIAPRTREPTGGASRAAARKKEAAPR